MNRTRIHIFSILPVLLFTVFAFAQDSDLKKTTFKRIGIDRGLSQSCVEAILQDTRGFMWFATQDGLNCYDGHDFKVYKNNITDKNSISSNFINCLYLGRSGLIWIGTKTGGLNSFDPQTGKFKTYRSDPDDLATLSNNNVSSIYEDRNNKLWVGTEGGGLDVLDLNTDLFDKDKIKFQKYNSTALSSNIVTAICEDKEGRLWVGTVNGLCI